MKKNIKLMLAVCGCFIATAGFAQKVTQSSNGAIIEASAIPHTTTKKARETDGTNAGKGSNTVTNIGSALSNEKVYYKLEIYRADNSSGTDWLAAVNLCKTLTVNGGGWRLPTYRELVLMWVLKTELERISGFSKFTTTTGGTAANPIPPNYWSATEHHANTIHSHYQSFSDGKSLYAYKTNRYLVRCVRDL